MLLSPRRPGARSDAFPRGYGCYRTATYPKNLSRAGHIRSIVHASDQAPDLSQAQESIRGSGKRGDRRPFPHAGGIFPSRHEKAPAPTFPTRAGHPSHHPQDNRARNLSHAGDTGGSGSRHPPSPFLRARGYITQDFDSIRRILPFLRARGHIPRHLRERSGHPLSYARGGASSAPSGYNGNVHTSLRARGIRERPRAYASSRTFPTHGAIAISSLPAFLRTRDRAHNRETRQHHAGPFRAGPFRLRGKVRVPLPFGSGLPFAGFCRLRVPGRTAFVRHRGAPPLPHAFRTPAVSTGIPPRSRGVTPSRIVLTAVAAPDRIVIDCH